MPRPPTKGESKKVFIARCMTYMYKNEPNRSKDQMAAVCYSMYDRRKKDKK